jgi:hypothetical protein
MPRPDTVTLIWHTPKFRLPSEIPKPTAKKAEKNSYCSREYCKPSIPSHTKHHEISSAEWSSITVVGQTSAVALLAISVSFNA